MSKSNDIEMSFQFYEFYFCTIRIRIKIIENILKKNNNQAITDYNSIQSQSIPTKKIMIRLSLFFIYQDIIAEHLIIYGLRVYRILYNFVLSMVYGNWHFTGKLKSQSESCKTMQNIFKPIKLDSKLVKLPTTAYLL